jgi:hypothetical protein
MKLCAVLCDYVGRILGKGAMKTVYKEIDEVLGIDVARNQE